MIVTNLFGVYKNEAIQPKLADDQDVINSKLKT